MHCWLGQRSFPLGLALIACFTLAGYARPAPAELPDAAALRGWIQDMKERERGPFSRIRWFCNDGSILPPDAYACQPHGGGSQHGEWTEQVKRLRDEGYFVANVLADLDVAEFLQRPDHRDAFNQMLIEQFLINFDDGWILRKARYYRGALQEEGERWGAQRLLFELAENPRWLRQDFVVLRAGARLLEHGAQTNAATQVRQVSAALARRDPGFQSLRNKIHVRPEREDAAAVRRYAAGVADPELAAEYQALADTIEQVYAPGSTPRLLRRLAEDLAEIGDLKEQILGAAAVLEDDADAEQRFAVTAHMLSVSRDVLPRVHSAEARVRVLDTALALEQRHFAAATELRSRLPSATRRQRIIWLQQASEAVYGAGLISGRQRRALHRTVASLADPEISVARYKRALDYLALVPGWSSQRLRFHFYESMRKLTAIEPLADLFIQDQLRGSPLFFFAVILDDLLRDANRLAGVRNVLFQQDVGAGLRSLNPGLARGTLHTALDADDTTFAADGIYLLPETISELPPVAGILTAGEGNPLSHVQLLARNLGIPNVGVDANLIPNIEAMRGMPVMLAVSPGGSVRLLEDDDGLASIFGQEKMVRDTLIEPDLEKLDLDRREFLRLSELRAADSGRTVGPKAAKLGELKHHYPEAVAEGLTIPFGVFRDLLRQPYKDTGDSVFQWMVGEYQALAAMPADADERAAATDAFRGKLYQWILSADPGNGFRQRLAATARKVFGEDGRYGVFVRSDTNVEDLPGFTGAGLNLTVPNVVGLENIYAAISRVWASPFTARAFAWRQIHMSKPEHVYPAVLLMRSVPVDKSGVLVTRDIDSGDPGWLSVAVNEGVGGAVDGQAAESLRINLGNGDVRLLAQATAPMRRRVNPVGGVDKIPVTGGDTVLTEEEIDLLMELARELPLRFPIIVDAQGIPAPADIEFGFLDGRLMLFQIRPFLESKRARGSEYLKSLDSGLVNLHERRVDMNATPQAVGW